MHSAETPDEVGWRLCRWGVFTSGAKALQVLLTWLVVVCSGGGVTGGVAGDGGDDGGSSSCSGAGGGVVKVV